MAGRKPRVYYWIGHRKGDVYPAGEIFSMSTMERPDPNTLGKQYGFVTGPFRTIKAAKDRGGVNSRVTKQQGKLLERFASNRRAKNPRRKRNTRKAINATAYVICVRVNKQTGYFTGTGFDTAKGRARMYRTQTDALKIGQQLADKYRTPVNVKQITVSVIRKRNPSRAGSPQIISGRETFKDTARAAKLFKDFTGEKPGHRERIKIPNLPKVAMAVGSLDGIDYTTVRDGVTERYHHPFKRDARPALAVSPSGKQLLIVGGRYTFTDRGIEDG